MDAERELRSKLNEKLDETIVQIYKKGDRLDTQTELELYIWHSQETGCVR
jgi:hypothetical protein